ncbi:uncharacterized protein LOC128034949 [Gossypium raimondii]|uniref:uncharacterized protein LOC128034949 n=1 Tax=Gossypium raimondii TaxID=29730 RepID=UPI00227CF048|nr:uncharacterized protein LOC128034949 [Gossypium raimondii]
MTNWSSLRGHRDIVMIPTPGAPNGADGQPSTDHYQVNSSSSMVKEKHWDLLRNCPEVKSIINQIEEKWPLLSDLKKIKEKRSEILTEFKAGRLKEDGAMQELLELKERLSHVDGQLQELHKANNLEVSTVTI